MFIQLFRQFKTDRFTMGQMVIDGNHFCWTMEDVERIIGENCQGKIPHETCIPKGTYTVILSFSNRFQKYMPEVLNVPCFSGIRIHSGNLPEHSDGCILAGFEKTTGAISQSRAAFAELMKRLRAVEKKEKIILTIE